MKVKELKEKIKKINEPKRKEYGNLRHKLEDIIIIGLCTVICREEDFVDMEVFGKSSQEYLAKFLELPNDIPDNDTFRRGGNCSLCLLSQTRNENRHKKTVSGVPVGGFLLHAVAFFITF